MILDAKRGDVGNTAERYAIEAFERYGADAVTVNPYLGTRCARALPAPRRQGRDRPVPHLQSRRPRPAGSAGRRRGRSTRWWRSSPRSAGTRAATACWSSAPPTRRSWPRCARSSADMPLLVPGIGAQGGDVDAGGARRADRRGHRTSRELLARHPLRLRGCGLRAAPRARRPQRCASEINRSRVRAPMRARAGALLGAFARARWLLGGCARSRGSARGCRAGGDPGARRRPGSGLARPAEGARLRGAEHPARPVRGAHDARPATRTSRPGVARSWSVSADGRTYTFRLRPEARWSNGDRGGGGGFRGGAASAWSIRRPPPATRSTSTSSPTPTTSSPASKPPARPRRRRTRRCDARHHARRALRPTCRRCCRTRAPARCTAPTLAAHPQGFARAGRHACQRRVRA